MADGRAEVDAVFDDCIRLPSAIDSELNRAAARADLSRLLSEVRVVLYEPPDTAAGAQVKAINEVADLAHRLRVAITKHEDALLQAVGYRSGRVIDDEGQEHRTWQILHRLALRTDEADHLVGDLHFLFRLKFTHMITQPKGGRAVDTRRLRALMCAANYFVRWTGEPPKPSRTSRFSKFAVRLFVALGFGDGELDLRHFVRKIAKARAQGTNFET